MKQAILAAVTSLILCAPSHAAVLFSQTLTGAGLLSDSNVSIFENPTLNGSRLDYTSRSVLQGALLRWDILGAASYGNLTVDVQIDHDVLSGPDNDLYFALSDGVNFVSASRVDNSGGAIQLFDGIVNGGAVPTPTFGTTFINALSSLGAATPPVDFSMLLPSGGGNATLLSASTGGSSTTSTSAYDTGIDTSNDLQFYLFGDGVPEQYGINSISITVQDESAAVNAPGALGLFALGLTGLGYRRIRQIA